MPQAKFKPFCGKLSYKTEQGAWEHVIYWKRKGYPFQKPYLCPDCNTWHLTRKHYDGKVPQWVWDAAHRTPKKKKALYKEEVLPLEKQRELYKQINNPPPSLLRKIRWWVSQLLT